MFEVVSVCSRLFKMVSGCFKLFQVVCLRRACLLQAGSSNVIPCGHELTASGSVRPRFRLFQIVSYSFKLFEMVLKLFIDNCPLIIVSDGCRMLIARKDTEC
jgi:hypothetical protein